MMKVISEIIGAIFSLPWLVAKDYGLFQAEGIDMEFAQAQLNLAISNTENPEEVNPILGHVALEETRVSIYRAWEEGQVRRAYESKQGAKIIALRSAVASQAILVRPDSPHY